MRELDNDPERALFDLQNLSGFHIKLMLECADSENVFNVKLEEISTDTTLMSHLQMFMALGFRGNILLPALDIAARHSLWAMQSLPAHATGGVKPLAPEFLGTTFQQEYTARFGDAHSALGY